MSCFYHSNIRGRMQAENRDSEKDWSFAKNRNAFFGDNPYPFCRHQEEQAAADGEWHSDSEIKIDKLGYVIRNGAKTKEFWDGTVRSDKQPLRLKIQNICGDETEWDVC